MIVGGYNIIDFEGKEFIFNQNITVTKDIVDKLKDVSKPCVIGNLSVTSDGYSATIAPMFSGHFIVAGKHTHNMADVTISVTGDTTIMFGA